MAVPLILTGSTSGRGILVVATATAGTLIHTAAATADGLDELVLWAGKVGTGDVLLTLEWGGVTSPGDTWSGTIIGQGGLQPIAPGLRLQGGLVVRAFAGTASVISIFGHVNRYRIN